MTYVRWLHATLLANAVDIVGMPLSLARDVADILIQTGRGVSPYLWVDHFVAKAQQSRDEQLGWGLPHRKGGQAPSRPPTPEEEQAAAEWAENPTGRR